MTMPKFKDWCVGSISDDRISLHATDIKTGALVHVWLKRTTLKPLSGTNEPLHSNMPGREEDHRSRHTTRSLKAQYGLTFMAEAKAVIRDGGVINNAVVAETRAAAERQAAEHIAALKHRKQMAGERLYDVARAIFKNFAAHLPEGARDVESWAKEALHGSHDERIHQEAIALIDAAELFREIENGPADPKVLH